MMNTALVSDECDCDEGEHYEENNALFVFREIENPEQMFYSVWHSFGIRYVGDYLRL
jgi:hypothetical protein